MVTNGQDSFNHWLWNNRLMSTEFRVISSMICAQCWGSLRSLCLPAKPNILFPCWAQWNLDLNSSSKTDTFRKSCLLTRFLHLLQILPPPPCTCLTNQNKQSLLTSTFLSVHLQKLVLPSLSIIYDLKYKLYIVFLGFGGNINTAEHSTLLATKRH